MSSLSEIIIKSENEMQKLGKFLSKIFKPYDIITLNGEVVELRETVEDMQNTIQELQDKLEELTID